MARREDETAPRDAQEHFKRFLAFGAALFAVPKNAVTPREHREKRKPPR